MKNNIDGKIHIVILSIIAVSIIFAVLLTGGTSLSPVPRKFKAIPNPTDSYSNCGLGRSNCPELTPTGTSPTGAGFNNIDKYQ